MERLFRLLILLYKEMNDKCVLCSFVLQLEKATSINLNLQDSYVGMLGMSYLTDSMRHLQQVKRLTFNFDQNQLSDEA